MTKGSPADPQPLLNELVELWENGRGVDRHSNPTLSAGRGHFLGVFSLAYHVRTIAEPAANLISQGNTVAAMPLVRAAYETALTAQWAALTKHSIETLLHVHDQSLKTLADDLASAASPALLASVNDEPYKGTDVEHLDSSAYAAARRFKTMCEDLMPQGSDKYVFYRFMSLGVHPGVNVMNQYLISDGPEGGPDTVKLRAEPLQRGLVEWMGFLAASLLWALTAVDYLERGNPNKRPLDDVGARMQVTPMLALTQEARVRYFAEARAIRQSSWVGPRPKKNRNSAEPKHD